MSQTPPIPRVRRLLANGASTLEPAVRRRSDPDEQVRTPTLGEADLRAVARLLFDANLLDRFRNSGAVTRLLENAAFGRSSQVASEGREFEAMKRAYDLSQGLLNGHAIATLFAAAIKDTIELSRERRPSVRRRGTRGDRGNSER